MTKSVTIQNHDNKGDFAIWVPKVTFVTLFLHLSLAIRYIIFYDYQKVKGIEKTVTKVTNFKYKDGHNTYIQSLP